MKKKGFTLIELLAVLVILGVLLTLAVSAVSKYVVRGKKAYYQGLEKNIKVAAQDYYADFKTLLPRQIGETATVTLNELVLNNYIDPVQNEDDKDCVGTVIVSKIDKSKYDYSVCLQCDKYNTEGTCDYVDSDGKKIRYDIQLNGTLNEEYNQCDEIFIPTATVYKGEKQDDAEFKQEIINRNLKASISNDEINSIGEFTLKWTYGYEQLKRNIVVKDNIAPSKPVVSLQYFNGSSYTPRIAGTEDIIITNQDLLMNVVSEDGKCTNSLIQGSGLKNIIYSDGIRDNVVPVTSKKSQSKVTLSDTLFGDVDVFTVDNVGNESLHTSMSVYLDKNAPSKTIVNYLGGDNTPKWKNDYKLELIADDDIAVAYFELYKDGVFIENIYKDSVSEKFIFVPNNQFSSDNVQFRAVDIAGNKGEFSNKQIIRMDTEAPGNVSIDSNGYVFGEWFNQNIVLDFNALDNVGIDHYEYSFDMSNVNSISSELIISTDQDTKYYFRAVDEAGNVGPWTDAKSIKRDSVKPTLTLGNVGATTKSIAIPILESSDDRSGIEFLRCVYGTNTSYGTNGTIENGQCVLKGRDDTEYFYKITLVDNAGNIKEIANSAKTEEFGNISITPDGTDWNNRREYTISGSTDGAKLQFKIISTSDSSKNTDWIDIENGEYVIVSGNHTTSSYEYFYQVGNYATAEEPLYIMARLYDGENTSDAITYTEIKYDYIDPNLETKNKIITTNSIIQTFELSDEHSGINNSKNKCTYSYVQYNNPNIYDGEGIYQDGTCIFNNLKDDTMIYYAVRFYDYAGNNRNYSFEYSTKKFNDVLITPTTTDWDTSRTIKFSSDGDAQIQYKVVVMSDMSKNIDWTNIDNGGSITLNDLATTEAPTYVYARLNDGVNTSSEISYTEVALDPSTYNISYDLAGSTVSGNPSTFNVSNTFTLNNPTKNGYNFIGWTGSNGVNPEVTVKVNKGTRTDLSYTANFSLKNFDVSIVSNNSLVSSSNINVNYGGSNTFTLTPNTGYYLSGVSCTNGYTASAVLNSLDNQTITINNNNIDNSSTCTLTLTRVTASNLSYDNTNTGLSCTDAQCALDKIAEMLK